MEEQGVTNVPVVGVLIARLIDGKSKLGRLFGKPQTEQTNDLERVVPIHDDRVTVPLSDTLEVLSFVEHIGIKRGLSRSCIRAARQCSDTVELSLGENPDVTITRPKRYIT